MLKHIKVWVINLKLNRLQCQAILSPYSIYISFSNPKKKTKKTKKHFHFALFIIHLDEYVYADFETVYVLTHKPTNTQTETANAAVSGIQYTE